MDVLRLDPVTYLPDALVEGYSSMIWTERYEDSGEFEMSTPLVSDIKIMLPEGSLITLRDSQEVMFVETHSIEIDSDGIPELKVKGRTFETFLENRDLIGTYKKPWQALLQYTTAEMLTLLLWDSLVNATGEDTTRVDQIRDILTAIPDIVITDSSTFVETPKIWWLEEGEVYKTFLDFLKLGGLGVRNIRPMNTTANVVSFDTTRTPTRGTLQKVTTPNISQLRLDVYNGLDRTHDQTVNVPVIFHYGSGHIESPQYLFSIKDLKNMATISASFGTVDIWPDTGIVPPVPNPSGLDRRILYIDGGDEGDQVHEDFLASIVQKGMIELKKHNRSVLFDGAISPLSPYKYGTEYFLGDKVTLSAEYGFEASMLVAEYVRTEDQAGDRGYPTLVLAN